MAGAFYGKQLNHPKEKKLKLSESYIVMHRHNETNVAIINCPKGEEAERIYEHLTNQKVGVIRDDHN